MKTSLAAAAGLAAALACAAPASAAASRPAGEVDAHTVCDGNIDIIRVSRLKPGATLSQFEDAVAAHVAWYRSHGMASNSMVVARVLNRDAVGGITVSPTDVMTIHLKNPIVTFAQMDAGWDAYVAKYRAVSDIVSETIVCDSNE
jgi:hypothetical protein